MRQTNIFRTTKRDHHIPREVMIKALRLSPGKDWTNPETDAYQYLKDWALNEDQKKDGPLETPLEKGAKAQLKNYIDVMVTDYGEVEIPESVMKEAKKLSPKKDPHDKRTKAYKFLKAYADAKTVKEWQN